MLKKVITADETWIYDYDVEIRPNNPNGNAQKRQNRESSPSLIKCENFVYCFLRLHGALHHVFLSTGRTVNKKYYKKVEQCFRDAIRLSEL